jgi:hypothetical protein
MGNVIISSNIKKESVRINPDGDIINAKTKQVIQKNDETEVLPPQSHQKPPEAPETNDLSKRINSMVEAKISEKINKIVEDRVNEALKNI